MRVCGRLWEMGSDVGEFLHVVGKEGECLGEDMQ